MVHPVFEASQRKPRQDREEQDDRQIPSREEVEL
jgi:hypothetical protein